MSSMSSTSRRDEVFGTEPCPDTPVAGEESFVVTLEDGLVLAEITAFSRPDRWFTKLGPLTRLTQHRATNRYLAALCSAVLVAAR